MSERVGITDTIAGVQFKDGEFIGFAPGVDDPERARRACLRYLREMRYVIDEDTETVYPPNPAAPADEPIDPRSIGLFGSGITSLGTLRDAAVDPRPSDFLPPTNAGKANPHGPDVIAPEVHGSQGVRPVKGGDVSDKPSTQEVAESIHAEAMTTGEVTQPARNASKAAWVEFAVQRGADREQAEAMHRDELVDTYSLED